MEKMTITEGLAEIHLIEKKIDKKKSILMGHTVKPVHIKDQLESEGGSKKYILSEIQSINDLVKRHVAIRGAIAKANIETSITLNDKTDTIHNWLTWRRDYSAKQIALYKDLHVSAKNEIDRLTRSPQVYKDEKGEPQLLIVESNVDIASLIKQEELMQETFDKLDGQLSLKNATVIITI